ncbi:conserved hypothetical protein [Gammaproteobacteria bacterium]
MDIRLLEILVCPLCKGGLRYDAQPQELICEAEHLAYPIRDGIPVMLEEEARRHPTGLSPWRSPFQIEKSNGHS